MSLPAAQLSEKSQEPGTAHQPDGSSSGYADPAGIASALSTMAANLQGIQENQKLLLLVHSAKQERREREAAQRSGQQQQAVQQEDEEDMAVPKTRRRRQVVEDA